MKRTPMPPRTTELQRRPGAVPSGSARWGSGRRGSGRRGSGGVVLPRFSRLPAVSRGRRAPNRELAAVVAAKRETARFCQAQPMLHALLAQLVTDGAPEADRVTVTRALQTCMPWRPERPHHRLKRSRGSRADLVNPANIMMICPSCDDFTEAEVRLSTAAGLLIPSRDRRP